MDEAATIEVVFAPAGFVFELLYVSRSVPFLEGVFRQLVSAGGHVWAADFQFAGGSGRVRWRQLDLAGANEIGLRPDAWPRR